jgi:hypothetical protein
MRLLRALLVIGTGLCFTLALLLLIAAASAWMERAARGPGPMFAAAGFFGLAALAFVIVGVVSGLLARAIGGHAKRNEGAHVPPMHSP